MGCHMDPMGLYKAHHKHAYIFVQDYFNVCIFLDIDL